MKIIRVFPRRTKATPVDELVRVGEEPGLFDEADEVHVSVSFTWDIPLAERLARSWERVAPVKIGGPATEMVGGDFTPGMYLRPGYVITSRGCNNRCWFCSVWRREGDVRELPITDGWNVLDDNLLACSREHIRGVFSMLSRQSHRAEFTGGLEAKDLEKWIPPALALLKPKSVFFAYDTRDDAEPLREAGKMMIEAGFTVASHVLRCYVLIGYPKDSIEAAETRLRFALSCGFTPMAMLYRDTDGRTLKQWRAFQREWARPAIIHSSMEGRT
jgi:hypothetical protein